jgi:hypothetical protein
MSHRIAPCSKICENRWLSRDSCESWQHDFYNVYSEPSSSIDSMVKYTPSWRENFHTTWLLFLLILYHSLSMFSASTRCDIKGFIITIQSNSIRIEVASTWRRRKHTMERQVDCFWRAHNFEMVATIPAIRLEQFPRRDLFMCWMVSDTLTLYSYMVLNDMQI